MTRQQRARRRAIAATAIGFAILTIAFMGLPMLGGYVTGEQPAAAVTAPVEDSKWTGK